MRQRIALSVDGKTLAEYNRIVSKYGFRSVSEIINTMLTLYARRVERKEEFNTYDPDTVREIDDLFAEFRAAAPGRREP